MIKNINVLVAFFALLFSCTPERQHHGSSEKKTHYESLIDDWTEYAIKLEDTNLDSAAYYYQKVAKLADSLDSYYGKIKFAYNFSEVLNQRGEFEESEKINRSALELAQAKNDTLNIAKGLNNVANTFNYRNLYDTAFVYYVQSAEHFKKLNFPKIYIIYSNIGSLLNDMELWNEAIVYFDQALPLAEAAQDSLQLISILNNKGIALGFQKQQKDAMLTFRQALPYVRGYPQSYQASLFYSNYANALKRENQPDSAIYYFKKQLEISKKYKNEIDMGVALQGLSMVYFKSKDYQSAQTYLEESSKYLDNIQSEHTLGLYKIGADINYHLRNYDLSYKYFAKYIDLRDTIQQEKILRSISQAEKKFKLAQKEEELLIKELLLAKSQLENKKKNWYLALGVLLVVTLASISYLLSRNIKQKNKLFIAERNNLQKEKEMSILRASIDGATHERLRIAKELHDDLGTGLTSLRFLSEKMINQTKEEQRSSTKKIQELTKGLTEQISEIIWSMDADSNTLDELLTFIRVKMATLLEENDIRYQFVYPNEVPNINLSGFFRRHVYLLVKEAVHNAIKHSGTDSLQIEVHTFPNLSIRILDQGCGLPLHKKPNLGNGFRNMETRIQALSGSWNIQTSQGTSVYFDIPYSQN